MRIAEFFTSQTTSVEYDLVSSIMLEGHELFRYETPLAIIEPIDTVEDTERAIYNFIKANNAEMVITWNYFVTVSNSCEKLGVPYISWLYDSPLLHVYSKNMKNSCNYIFAFDRTSAKDIRSKGGNAYYMPLACNIDRTSKLEITDEEIEFYKRDISFVGSLYQKNPYNSIEHQLPDILRARYNQMFIAQLGNWKENLLYDIITDDELELFKRIAPVNRIEEFKYISDKYIYCGFLLARKFAEYERKTILNILAANHQVTIYNSKDDLSVLKNVECRPGVSYEIEAPKVFYSSKINLGMTLRSIETGIPLRDYDIMGVGGFLMSNYQQEFEDLYEPGKDMVMFKSFEEMQDLADYYLKHEDERMRIAMNGYQTTAKYHTTRQRIRRMIEIVQGK